MFLVLSFIFIQTARAQIPPPPTVPCNQVRPDWLHPFDEEFHSLRPYQASPCSDETEPSALFCGNDLVLQDSFTVSRSQRIRCDAISPDTEECIFEITRDLDIAVDVSGAELPIMGRTEDDVINSLNLSETRSDADKVNEYVSWYLNGTNIAAEYGYLDAGNEDDISKLVNFSGPIKKLLPERIKRDEIRETIEAREATRHDQVVGCVKRFGIYVRIVECYSGGGETEIRLSDLADHLPPQEEDPRFANYQEFLWAYFRWRGYECPNIPIVNITVCFEAPWLFNFWADLYYLTPLSSTEDRLGEIKVVNPYVQPVTPGMFIFVNRLDTTPAKLFFSHMEESNQLANLLQSTYTPKDEEKVGPPSGISPVTPIEYCDITDIRTNPGDDLFAGEIGVDLTYTANFSCTFNIFDPADPIGTYWCDYAYGGRCYTDDWDCNNWGFNNSTFCPSGYRCGYPPSSCSPDPPDPSCPATAQVVLNTVTKTPLVDDIWSRLVAGPSAVFKRIFPKVEPGAPVEGILDIPGATGVTYSAEINGVSVPVAAGNPGNTRGGAAELYFPHIGGIEQYFLQCIQTALRPQGFGEVCESGPPPVGLASCGEAFDQYNPPTSTTPQASSFFTTFIMPNLTDEIINVYAEAEGQTGVPCEVLAGIHFIEGGNDPNQSLISGRPIGSPEPDAGGRIFNSLLETAIYAANDLKAKVGGTIDSWESLITALSRYNGGGNSNCQTGYPWPIPYTGCPRQFEGEDDIYPMSWLDARHSSMYLLFCADYTPCPPQPFLRPGVLSVAVEFVANQLAP